MPNRLSTAMRLVEFQSAFALELIQQLNTGAIVLAFDLGNFFPKLPS